MKKNFFKKLSFVMALAMMISVIAPAAGAFAASKPVLNATSKTLLLGSADRSEFDFDVKNKVTGASYKWASSNKAVATVNANGLTKAVATGATKVSVKITKSGKTTTLTAKVVVKDNIAAITEIVAPAGADVAKLAVATDYDFGRKFKTESGSTTKTTSVTRWVVSEGATITNAGVFNASTAGKYTITAVAFQSVAKYDAWVAAGSDLKSGLVLASKALDVTVAYTVKEVKQLSTTKVAVTFDADMSKTDVKTATVLAKVVNGANVTTGAEKVKSATLDSTGKVLTVEVYSTFTSKAVYNVIFGDAKGSFTAANVDLSEVTSLVFANSTANVNGTATVLTEYVSGANKDGVIIYDGANSTALVPFLAFSYTGEAGKAYVTTAGSAYVYTTGYVAPVTVKYTNYVLDSATNTYKTVTAEASATVTGVVTAVDGATMQYAVLDGSGYSSTTKWGTTAAIAAKDAGYRIYTRYKKTTDAASAAYTYEAYDTVVDFIYESSNIEKLVITGNYLYPVSEGTVTVIVKKNDSTKAVVGTFDLTIKAARTFATATATVGVVTVANTALYNNTTRFNAQKIVINVADSLGDAFVPTASATPAFVSGPSNAVTYPTFGANPDIMGATSTYKGMVIYNVYGGVGIVPGQYVYKVTLTHPATGATKDVTFVVNVIDGASTAAATVTQWKVELQDSAQYIYTTSVDLKEMSSTKNLNVKVFGYNAAGVKVDELASTDFTVAVKDATGATVGTSATVQVITTTGGSVLYPMSLGSYTVAVALTGSSFTSHASLATRVAGASIAAPAVFTVSDSTVKTAVSAVANNVVTSTTNLSLFDIVKGAYNFTLNGVDVNEANITKVTYAHNGQLVSTTDSTALSTPINNATSYYISSVEVTVTNPGIPAYGIPTTYTVYTYTIGANVTLK